ncbi:MAG TPA: Crp/Fnr family transcriptional regulator [bacterium]
MGKERDLLEDYFRQVPLFRHLPRKHAEIILRDFAIRRARKGDVLVTQGEEGTELYIILQGGVRVVLESGEGEEFVLNEMPAGSFFGEVSLIDAESRSATVIADRDTVLAVLRRERLLDAIRDEPRIALDLLKALARIVRRSTEREGRLAFLDVRERLCRLFLQEAAVAGTRTPEGFLRIAKRSHRDLSTRIGASRESVTKVLKALARDGLLREEENALLISVRICQDGPQRPPRAGGSTGRGSP